MPEPLLPRDLVTAIGRVTVNGLRLEADVTLYLWQQRELPHIKPADGKRSPDVFSTVITALRKYAKANLTGDPRTRVLAGLYRAERVQSERHQCVHGIWSARPNARGKHAVSTIRNPNSPSYLSVSDVNDIANRIHMARGELMGLIPILDSLSPAGRNLRVAVSAEEMAELNEDPLTPGIA